MGTAENNPATSSSGQVFSLLREAATALPAQGWGNICADALCRSAGGTGGLLLDGGGVTVGVYGLDDLEAYELAMLAMSAHSSSGALTAVLDRRTLSCVVIPLRVDGRSAATAIISSEDPGFPASVSALNTELVILGSAMLSQAPWMRGTS